MSVASRAMEMIEITQRSLENARQPSMSGRSRSLCQSSALVRVELLLPRTIGLFFLSFFFLTSQSSALILTLFMLLRGFWWSVQCSFF